MSRIVFLIPNYCGSELLHRCLPSVIKNVPANGNLTIIDDSSSDDSVQMLAEYFSDVPVIKRQLNGGFSAAVNDGICNTNGDLIILLNNDVELPEGFLDPILPLFDDPTVFSVSPRILLPSQGNLDEGCKTGVWHHGVFYVNQRQDVSEVAPTLYSTGCAAVYRRSMIEKLSGFDEAYSPFYWEDVDLCYRAWKRGWKSLYQPASTAYHMHSASISKMNHSKTARVKARNSLQFIWRNIEDSKILARHRLWMPFVLSKRIAQRDWAFLNGWCDAYSRRHEAMNARAHDSQFRVLSDREIFAECGVDWR